MMLMINNMSKITMRGTQSMNSARSTSCKKNGGIPSSVINISSSSLSSKYTPLLAPFDNFYHYYDIGYA